MLLAGSARTLARRAKSGVMVSKSIVTEDNGNSVELLGEGEMNVSVRSIKSVV